MYNQLTPPDQNENFCKLCGIETSDLYFNSIDFVCTDCLENAEISECQICHNPDYSKKMISNDNQDGFICTKCHNSNVNAINDMFKSINQLFNI